MRQNYILIGRSIDPNFMCIKNTSELDFELRNSGLIAGGYTYFFSPDKLPLVVAFARLRGYDVEYDYPFTASLEQADAPHTEEQPESGRAE